MPYTRTHPVGGWKDRPDQSTPILAANLEHIEDGIEDVTDAHETLAAQLPSIYVSLDGFDATVDTAVGAAIDDEDIPGQVATAVAADPTVTTAAAAAVSTAIAAGGILKATQPPELARNRAINPEVSGGPVNNANTSLYTISGITTGLPAGFSFGAKSIRKGSLDSGIGDFYLSPIAGANAAAIPVTPGEIISLGAYGWTSDPLTAGTRFARLLARFYDASDALVSTVDTSTSQAFAVSTWELRKAENVTVPALATHVVVEFRMTASGGTATTGGEARATGVMVNSGATLLPYGDGNSSLWAWTGTPHASPSIQVFKSKTDLDAMASEIGAAAAVQSTVYSGVTASKNLYNPADPNVLNDTGITGSGPTLPTVAGYRVTGWIPVTPGQQITAGPHRHVYFVNSSFTKVGSVTNTGADSTVATYTVAAGVAYARFDFKYTTFPNFQVEIGASQTSYVPWTPSYYTLSAMMKEAARQASITAPTDPVTLQISGSAVTITTLVGGLPLVTTCGKTSSDQGEFGINTVTYNGVAVGNVADSVCPLRLANLGTVGGDHGYTVGVYVAPNPDGKTTADLGSRWHDTAGREYVLVAITASPSTPLMFLGSYTGGSGTAVAVVATLPATDLTHVSGATHTGSIPVGGIVAGSANTYAQLVPSTARPQLSITLDGLPITVDGTYYGKNLKIRESYEILDYQSIYETAKANVGVSISALTVAGAILVQNVYKFGPNGVEPGFTTYDELTPTPLGECGAVQNDPLDQSGAGKTTTRYVPGMGTVGGLDWSAGVDYTSYAASNNLPASAARVSGRIPTFSMDTLSASGVVSLGFAMGYLPFGSRTDSASRAAQRATHASTQLWDMRSTKKCYPVFTTGEAAGWGHLQVDWFRAYLSPAQVAAVLVNKLDALTSFATLDTLAGLTAA